MLVTNCAQVILVTNCTSRRQELLKKELLSSTAQKTTILTGIKKRMLPSVQKTTGQTETKQGAFVTNYA